MPAKVARRASAARASRCAGRRSATNSSSETIAAVSAEIDPQRLRRRPGSSRAARSAARSARTARCRSTSDRLADAATAIDAADGQLARRPRRGCRPASTADRRVQLSAKPCSPPPCSRKNATTGNAMKNSPAFSVLAGARGISSGSSNSAASAKVRSTRQRSGSRIEAVDELRELRLHERPAGADRDGQRLGQAVGAVAARSTPRRPAGISRVGTTVKYSSSAPRMVSRMLVGELNSRVRTSPTKPVVFTGAGRCGTSSSARTKAGVIEPSSLMRPCSG